MLVSVANSIWDERATFTALTLAALARRVIIPLFINKFLVILEGRTHSSGEGAVNQLLNRARSWAAVYAVSISTWSALGAPGFLLQSSEEMLSYSTSSGEEDLELGGAELIGSSIKAV